MVEAHRAAVLEALWRVEDRCDKVSNKVEMSEVRQMRAHFTIHEFMRKLVNVIEEFEPGLDPTWALRTTSLEVSMFLRALIRDNVYDINVEAPMTAFLKVVFRFLFVHRWISNDKAMFSLEALQVLA